MFHQSSPFGENGSVESSERYMRGVGVLFAVLGGIWWIQVVVILG